MNDLIKIKENSPVFSIEHKTPPQIRNAILRLEEDMLNMPGAQTDCPVRHIFAPGLYAREMVIPKGIIIVGKIHKHAHVNTISKGKCSVITEFGEMELIAPVTFVSKPGTKRVVIANEETVWTTYHPSDETDLDKLEESIIAKSYDDLPIIENTQPVSKIEGEQP